MSRTWLITGTSSGLGHELTTQLLARGDRVAAIMRSPERLDELAAQYGDALWRGDADVTDGDRVRSLVALAWSDLGRVDVVVSNAGYGLFGALEELTAADLRRQVDTNIMGSLALIHAAVPRLRAQGGGELIQVSSMAGQMAAAGMSMYHLSKWAVEGLMEALHQELAPFDIRTCLVEPGSARTEFGGGSMTIGESLSVYDDSRPPRFAVAVNAVRSRFPATRSVWSQRSSTPLTRPSCRVACCLAPTPSRLSPTRSAPDCRKPRPRRPQPPQPTPTTTTYVLPISSSGAP